MLVSILEKNNGDLNRFFEKWVLLHIKATTFFETKYINMGEV